ncbi:chromosome transmission fidelity protein 18 homolog [Brachyhypopomus gauderio]|uniref:chromosome transmission fidelity protein 18 homolog n=1 Tax=Brachyhypopomus gauderio TaxID=698409 RepID=UPI004041EE59
MAASVLDISGLVTLQESPKRVTMAACHARKRPPATGDYITVTDSLGNRVYLSKKEDDYKAPDPRFLRNSQNALGLLAVPIEVLKEQVAERRHRQLVEDSQRLTELLNSGVDPELLEDEVMQNAEGEDGDAADEGSCSRLWVPALVCGLSYTELLSDDVSHKIHRTESTFA